LEEEKRGQSYLLITKWLHCTALKDDKQNRSPSTSKNTGDREEPSRRETIGTK
jgi:hypothetical protein